MHTEKTEKLFELFKPNATLKFWFSAIIIAITLFAFSVAYFFLGMYLEISGFFLLGIISLPLIYIILNSSKIWMYSVMFTMIPFVLTVEEGVSVFDIIVAIYLIGGLIIWFIGQIFVLRNKIIRNSADWVILFFFLLVVFNSIIAILNDVEFIDWGREYGIVFLTLYYFPLRETFIKKEDLKQLLIIMIPIMLITTVGHYYQYYNRLTSVIVEYAYQLQTSVKTNQTLYTVASLFGFIITFSQKSKIKEILLMFLTSLFVTGLIITFSRTFWVILFFGIIFLFIFLPTKKKITFSGYITILIFALSFIVYAYFQDNAKIMFNVIEKRFLSSTEGKEDLSVRIRFVEWNTVLNKIEENPLGGNGMAKKFTYYNFLDRITANTSLIHNGYLHFLYRVGIPLSLMYFFFYFFYTVRAMLLIKKLKEPFLKTINLAAFAGLITMWIANITSAQFVYKDGVWVTFFCIALIGICYNYWEKEEATQTNPQLTLINI